MANWLRSLGRRWRWRWRAARAIRQWRRPSLSNLCQQISQLCGIGFSNRLQRTCRPSQQLPSLIYLQTIASCPDIHAHQFSRLKTIVVGCQLSSPSRIVRTVCVWLFLLKEAVELCRWAIALRIWMCAICKCIILEQSGSIWQVCTSSCCFTLFLSLCISLLGCPTSICRKASINAVVLFPWPSPRHSSGQTL